MACALRRVWKIGHTEDNGDCPRIELGEVARMVSVALDAITPEAIMCAFEASGIVRGVEMNATFLRTF